MCAFELFFELFLDICLEAIKLEIGVKSKMKMVLGPADGLNLKKFRFI